MAVSLAGKNVSFEINKKLKQKIALLKRPPGLAVVLVGDDPASKVYTSRKVKVAEKLGFHQEQVILPKDVSEQRLLDEIERLNQDPVIDGILVQCPLPPNFRPDVILSSVDPLKDVDGFHPLNMGLLVQGKPRFVPCTPKGVMELLKYYKVPLEGQEALVIGRSNIVGRPMALLLEQANATVRVAHSKTRDLEKAVRSSDIVVAAVGRTDFVKASWIKPGAIVVDIGINEQPDGSLKGDIEQGPQLELASFVTPVPGGVGPMTIAMLMTNTYESALLRLS